MILYKLAKCLEERKTIHTSLEEANGDMNELLLKKEEVEQKMKIEAGIWLDYVHIASDEHSVLGEDDFVLNEPFALTTSQLESEDWI